MKFQVKYVRFVWLQISQNTYFSHIGSKRVLQSHLNKFKHWFLFILINLILFVNTIGLDNNLMLTMNLYLHELICGWRKFKHETIENKI